MKQINSIQVLRGVAAMAVVVSHSAHLAYTAVIPEAIPVGNVGASGVDIFFLISGFIMWTTTSHRASTPSDFLKNRIIRIVPMYWLCTFALVILALFANKAIAATTWDRVLMSLFFVPHRDLSGDYYPFLVPGWTLNLEMFFYVLFSFGLLIKTRTIRMSYMVAALSIPVIMVA